MTVNSTAIICTHNRAHLLKRALMFIACQTLESDQFEVIVVDDGSSDNTVQVCERMRSKMPNLRYVSTGVNMGIGRAANLGIQSARGEYLMFTDDDCVANENWAERLLSALAKAPIVAGAVESPVSNIVKLGHNIAQFGPFMPGRTAGPTDFIAGANMGFRRSVFENLNGFQEVKRCDPDMEIILRARLKGYQIYFAPDAIVTHDPDRFTLAEIFSYSVEHASSTIVLRNQYRSILRTPFILRSPALILATSPMFAFGVTAKYYLRNWKLLKLFWTFPLVYMLKLGWCWGAAKGLRTWQHSGEKA